MKKLGSCIPGFTPVLLAVLLAVGQPSALAAPADGGKIKGTRAKAGGLLAAEQVTIQGSPWILDGVRSNGNVTIADTPVIAGPVGAVGTVSRTGDPVLRLEPKEGLEPVRFPTLDEVLARIPIYRTVEGDLTLSEPRSIEGVTLVKGNVTIQGEASGMGAILATGNIRVEGNAQMGAARGKLSLFTETGTVTLAGDSSIGGAILGKTVQIEGKAVVHPAVPRCPCAAKQGAETDLQAVQ